jgi:hypothetical protein
MSCHQEGAGILDEVSDHAIEKKARQPAAQVSLLAGRG